MSRPTALVLMPRLPWPLDDGGRVALWQVLWSAAREYETVLLSMVPEGTESAPLPPAIVELGVEVVRVPHRPPAQIVAAWQGIAGPWPYTLARVRNRRFSAALRTLVRERRPAFALVNHLHLATYADDLGGVPMVLREQNLEYLWMARYARERGATPRGWYARVQVGRLRAAEAALCGRARLVLAIQDQEAEHLRRLAPGTRVETLPVGIDFARFREPEPQDPPVVLIAGALGWEPNWRGALRFLEGGWPLLRAEIPGVRLRIAGKEPPPALVEAAGRGGAEVTGYVASMADEFARSSLLLVPLWVGAGARVKIIEALAARLPVVATRLGAEGLGLEPGRHYLEADSPERQAVAAVALLRDPARRGALTREGRDFAERHWSLERVARRQNELCAAIAT